MDYHYDFAERRQQAVIFEAQLQLAAELKRPVVIHCREAVDECLAIMARFPTISADFHCFTGTADEARRILDALGAAHAGLAARLRAKIEAYPPAPLV